MKIFTSHHFYTLLTVMILCSLILVSQPVLSEVLPESLETDISETLDSNDVNDYTVELNVRIPMTVNENPVSGDEDLWATVIYHTSEYEDTGSIKRPTILLATAYRREIMGSMRSLLSFLPHDYNIVAVDMRGTGSGPGQWDPLSPAEQYDVAYIVDQWIPNQPWSDGIVGLTGGSYEGVLQYMASGLIETEFDPVSGETVPKHLKAMAPISAFSDVYEDIAMQGGNFNLEFMAIWITITDLMSIFPPDLYLDFAKGSGFTLNEETAQEALAIWEEHVDQMAIPLSWIMDTAQDLKNDWYETKSPMIFWPEKPDGGWYFDGVPTEYGESVIPKNLPVFTATGWFDIFERGALNNWQYGLVNHSDSDKAMIIGPWYHIDAAFLMEGVDGMGLVGIDGLFSWDVLVRWFDWKIKGKNDPFMEEFPVAMYIMGEDKWRLEKSWPLSVSRVEEKTFYLSKEKAENIVGDWFSLRNRANNYQLVPEPGTSDYYDKFLCFKYPKDDPVLNHNPLKLHGLTSRSAQRWFGFSPLTTVTQLLKYDRGISADSLILWEDERLDEVGTLTFTTGRLAEDMEIVGPLTLTFWASTKFTKPLTQKKIDKFIENLESRYVVDGNENQIICMADKKDVQWVVEVNDVFPAGRAKNITSGFLSAARRPYDPSNPSSVDPGYAVFDPFYDYPDKNPDCIDEETVYEYVIEILPTDNVFKKGHRVRLSISASDFPHFFPVLRPSANTIVLDEDHPARLEFKVANKNDEGKTWKWVEGNDISHFLMNGK